MILSPAKETGEVDSFSELVSALDSKTYVYMS